MRRPLLIVEGDDDRATLRELQNAGRLAGAELRTAGGKDRLARAAVDQAATGFNVIALRDLDDLDAAGVLAWFDSEIAKVGEIHDLLIVQGVPVAGSKQLLALLRAITGFRASPATYAERLVAKAAEVDPDSLDRVFGPLCNAIRDALTAPPA